MLTKNEIKQVTDLKNGFVKLKDTLNDFVSDKSKATRAKAIEIYNGLKEEVKGMSTETKKKLGKFNSNFSTMASMMLSLRATTNKFTQISTFGMSSVAEGTQSDSVIFYVDAIITDLKKALGEKVSKNSASAAMSAGNGEKYFEKKAQEGVVKASQMSPEEVNMVKRLKNKYVKLDEALDLFIMEKNKEARKQAVDIYNEIKELNLQVTPALKKKLGPVFNEFSTMASLMLALRATTNKFTQISTFGMSSAAEGTQADSVKFKIKSILSSFKYCLGSHYNDPVEDEEETPVVSHSKASSKQEDTVTAVPTKRKKNATPFKVLGLVFGIVATFLILIQVIVRAVITTQTVPADTAIVIGVLNIINIIFLCVSVGFCIPGFILSIVNKGKLGLSITTMCLELTALILLIVCTVAFSIV